MASHRLNPLYAIKECSSCGSLYTRECCSIGSLENKILVPEPESSPCCAKCGKPVDGPYCRGCAFLRKKFEEDLLTYCGENETSKDFEDISESSDDNTNVVNAPREPFVVNQDPGVKSSQDPPQIDHNCCYECGDSLDGIFCQRCICKSCGKGAHYGYNCPPKDPIISKPEPCNQTINEIPQTLPSLDPSCYSLPHVSKPNFVDNSPNFSYPPPQPQFETYSCELCGNDSHYGYDCPSRVPLEMRHEQQLVDYKIKEITNDLGIKRFQGEEIDEEYERDCEIRIQKLKQDFNEWGSEVRKKEQAYEEEKYSASRRYMLSITCDDEDDSIPLGDIMCLIIDPILEEFASELAHIAPIPSRIIEADFVPNDDTSSDDDSFENIEYVDASPSYIEYDSFEEVNDVEQEEKEFDLGDIFQIQDVILREKLLNIHRLISNIKSLKVNPTPDRVLKSLSLFPIPVVDSDSFLEESDTSLSHLDNSLPEFETFSNHTEKTRSGSTTTHANYSLPEYDSFFLD
ncbi:hypothetical protein Tco_0117753 [Tanacetum coccineum]